MKKKVWPTEKSALSNLLHSFLSVLDNQSPDIQKNKNNNTEDFNTLVKLKRQNTKVVL